MRSKIPTKNRGGQKNNVKVRYLVMAAVVAMWGIMAGWMSQTAEAIECPELRVVFARGSGSERWVDQNYLAFKEAIEVKLKTTAIDYEFIDLDYPAVGISDVGTLAGAFFGAGEAYEFGDSVQAGIRNLYTMVNSASCPMTKYILGGYSQGAMVVSGALSSLDADRLIYAVTFGDPKLYLPEGAGTIPAACKGENLSDYRMYVPDCQAYKGMLGAYMPYEPLALEGKVGTWCEKRDIFCSSKHWDLVQGISDHLAYVSNNLYEDASRVIFDKICTAFSVKNTVSSPHDTAIMIDSTGSMSGLIAQYKDEARRLAERTLATGGRVALYDYRDYQEGYMAKQRCSFESCTLEEFEAGLSAISVDGGGDTPESMLASSLQVMQELNWKQGSTKSIVVLTDAGYHEPDYDLNGTTRLDVVRLSKQIDPVNFYVVTTPSVADSYSALALETGGRVVTTVDDLTELTDYIMERYDSLPRVEEMDVTPIAELPSLIINEVVVDGDTATVKFTTNGVRTLVVLNDALLGMTDGDSVTINELNGTVENRLVLVPLGDGVRGESIEKMLEGVGSAQDVKDGFGGRGDVLVFVLPKVPNTGKC